MELVIYNPSEDGFLKSIDFNNEEIKKELTLRLEKYKGLVYSDEQIKLAKSDRATLNKFKEAIENKRKEIKKQCLKPYEDFELKIKEITALIDKPILEIDKQVKSYEEKLREEKREVITCIYNESIGDLSPILPLKRLWDDKWLNVTYNLSNISKEIQEAIEKVKKDLEVIGQLKSEFDLQVKDKYLQTLDLSQALQEKTRLEEQKLKLEEYKKQQEHPPEISVRAEIKEEFVMPTVVVNTEIITLDFRVSCTRDQLETLKRFLAENKIKFGRVM